MPPSDRQFQRWYFGMKATTVQLSGRLSCARPPAIVLILLAKTSRPGGISALPVRCAASPGILKRAITAPKYRRDQSPGRLLCAIKKLRCRVSSGTVENDLRRCSKLITSSSCDIHISDNIDACRFLSLSSLDYSRPLPIIPDAPPSIPASTRGLSPHRLHHALPGR